MQSIIVRRAGAAAAHTRPADAVVGTSRYVQTSAAYKPTHDTCDAFNASTRPLVDGCQDSS